MSSPRPFVFLAGAPPSATVTLDASIRSKDGLFTALATGLGFLDERVRDWDELADVLADASWQAGTEASIDHASLPDLPETELATYLECLTEAVARRSSLECAGLRITFRSADAPRVARLTGTAGAPARS